MKITLIGYSGSGKSTLARTLATHYQLPLLHLDTVQFLDNWQERPLKEAQAIVQDFMQQNNWVIDGNYRKFYRQERLETADCIIILAFSRIACLKRVIKRYLTYRHTTRPDMATGCHEKLDWEFLWWILFQGRTQQPLKSFQAIKAQYPNKTILITNQKQLDQFKKESHLATR